MVYKDRPTVGILVPGFEGSYYNLVNSSIIKASRRLKVNLRFFIGSYLNSPHKVEADRNIVYSYAGPGVVDGLIVFSGAMRRYCSDSEMEEFLGRYKGLPLLNLGYSTDEYPGVLIDQKSGMKRLVKHLIERHHLRRIAFAGGPEDNPDAALRLEAYKEALMEHDIPVDPEMITHGSLAWDGGRLAVRQLITRQRPEPEAIVAASDEVALGVYSELNERGMRIPGDMVLTGFDDISASRYTFPPLTTVKQPFNTQGALALELINKMIHSGVERGDNIVLPTELKIRKSCGCRSRTETLFGVRVDSDKKSAKKLPALDLAAITPDFIASHFREYTREVQETIKELGAALLKDLKREQGGSSFIEKIKEHIYNFKVSERELDRWNKISDRLFELFGKRLDSEELNHRLVLFHLDKEEVFKESYRVIYEKNLINKQHDFWAVREILERLVTCYELDELFETIKRQFHRVGVNCAYLSLFAGDKLGFQTRELPIEKSRLILGYNGRETVKYENEYNYNTADLVPGREFRHIKDNIFLIFPLAFNEQNFGQLIFEYSETKATYYEFLHERLCSTIDRIKQFNEVEDMVTERTIELWKTNEKLKELDIAKSNFFANISHDLRTPLSLIIGPLESFKSGDYGESIRYEDERVDGMLKNSVRLLKLINNLLDYSKIEAGKMSVHRSRNDIARLLRFYVSTVEAAAESRGLSINMEDRSGGEVISWIDRDLLDKAVFNLLSNALKFSSPGGVITLSLERGESCFMISVSDTGIGISTDKQETIFERYSQVEQGSSSQYEGTGIGLAFTKEIVELHNGAISVKSREGEGSTFTITLPYEDEEGESFSGEVDELPEVKSYLLADIAESTGSCPAYKSTAANDDVDSRAKVLIVDDTVDMLDFIVSLLESRYYVITAREGQEGLEAAFKHRPDLIICDVMMPEMDGYEFVKVLKSDEELKGTPVILLTARADRQSRLNGLELGADDYLSKPFNSKELIARINSNLEMKRLRDQVAAQRDELARQNEHLEDKVLEKTRHIEEEKLRAEKQLEDFLLVLGSAIESKDNYTGNHVDRVAGYASELAIKVGFDSKSAREVYLGAIVHDLGKIGVRDEILNKPGKLDKAEREAIRKHAKLGQKLLSKIGKNHIAEKIAYCHQERWDGKGYPRGLKGEEIPLEARIVTVADFWDAITTDRPYRKAFALEEAKELMYKERGGAFDPHLLDIFMNENDRLYMHYIDKPVKGER